MMKTLVAFAVLCLAVATAHRDFRPRPAPVAPVKQSTEETAKDLYIKFLESKLEEFLQPGPEPLTAGTVSFAVTRLSTLGPVAQDTVVTYDDVSVDTGNNFQGGTSFVAPLNGLYFFSYQFSGLDVSVNLMMRPDDVTAGSIVQTATVGSGDQIQTVGGGSIVLDLVAGNEIYVQLPATVDGSTNTIYSDPTGKMVAFSGFLLYQRI